MQEMFFILGMQTNPSWNTHQYFQNLAPEISGEMKRKNKIQEWVRGTEKGCECSKGKKILMGEAQTGKDMEGTVE